jgi:glycosyltransferase involved in cell wall biosynthesis
MVSSEAHSSECFPLRERRRQNGRPGGWVEIGQDQSGTAPAPDTDNASAVFKTQKQVNECTMLQQFQVQPEVELTNKILVTVLICTYNPCKHQFTQTLESLSNQSLPLSEWEVILVDNNSDSPLALEYPLKWHPNVKWVHEPKQGKPNAIVRGILCSKASLIITVDDDNLLDPDYLATAIKIQAENPNLGVFGSGRIEAAYEGALPQWFNAEMAAFIAIRQANQAMTSKTIKSHPLCTPWGIGLCITRHVALTYLTCCSEIQSQYSYLIGRKSSFLDDSLFSICAVNNGLSFGVFPELRAKHLIEPSRTTLPCILSLSYDNAFGEKHFSLIAGTSPDNPRRTGSAKAAAILLLKLRPKLAIEKFRHYIFHLKRSKQSRMLQASIFKGWNDAINAINSNNITASKQQY